MVLMRYIKLIKESDDKIRNSLKLIGIYKETKSVKRKYYFNKILKSDRIRIK